ncbi:MAG: lipopolysaccharide heptosyltransferase II [Pirellulales bacterium]|nr:lipopolysaccharide heptosyltransferase II [Pirellulales bacterium]
MKIAVFLPNWLGDVAMGTPALRALRRRFGPEAAIVGIMRPYLAEVLGGTAWLSEQWYFDPRSGDPKLRRRALIRRMRGERFDLAVLMPNSFSAAWTAWRGGARERIGYVRYARGPFLTGRAYPPRRDGRRVDEPMVDYYLRLASAAGCPPESPRLELATTEADERSAEAVWSALGLRRDGRVVALNSSGAYGGSKLWPVEHFAALARRIVDELDHDVLVMCGPKERPIAREIVARSGRDRVASMADQPLGMGTAKACLRRARLVVSTDSGPRHVAAALGRPVVTLFGPMLPVWSENPTQRAVNLILDLDCIGCHKRVCPLGHHRCMRDLSVEAVFGAVARLMDEETSAAAA